MKKKSNFSLLIVIILVAATFAVLEFFEPYFFLYDDNENYFIYVYKYTYDAILSGTIPIYNFRQFLGVPFFSAGQTGAINPLVIISCFLSELFLKNYSGTIDIMAFIHIELAAIGMYLVLKKHDVKTVISIVGSLAWAFNTFNTFIGRSWMIVLQTSAWIPFIILGTLYLYSNLSMKGILISSLPRIALFYCGHPQFFLWGMIYDFLYILIFVLPNNRKNENNKKFMLNYFISYIPVVFSALPLLGTMWVSKSASALRSGKMNLDDFLSCLIDFKTLIPGLINPFAEVPKGVLNYSLNRVGNFTYILMITFVIGFVALFFLKNKAIRSKLTSLYILSILSCMFSGSVIVVALMSFIPIINSFRFNFKYFMWFPFFAIIAVGIILSYATDKYLNKEKAKRIISIVFVVITIINIIVVNMFSTASQWSLKMLGNPSNPPSNLDELYSNNRYMCINSTPYLGWDKEGNLYGQDIFGMEFNIATALGYSNVLGYDTLTPTDVFTRFGDLKIDDWPGAANPENTDFIEVNNYLGVSTYVVNNFYIKDNRDLYSQFGFTEIYKSEYSTVCITDDALPVVRTADGMPVDYKENINSIIVNTNQTFEGGEILLMYSYSPYFEVLVNGKSSDIEVMENDYYTMKINAPAGENTIEIVYKDSTLTKCAFIGVAGLIAFLTVGYLWEKRAKSKKRNGTV